MSECVAQHLWQKKKAMTKSHSPVRVMHAALSCVGKTPPPHHHHHPASDQTRSSISRQHTPTAARTAHATITNADINPHKSYSSIRRTSCRFDPYVQERRAWDEQRKSWQRKTTRKKKKKAVPPTCKTGATEVLYRCTTRGMLSVPTLTVDSLAAVQIVRLAGSKRTVARGDSLDVVSPRALKVGASG